MGTTLDTVNRFYATTLERPDLAGIEPLIDAAITFEGPLQRITGATAYLDLNRQLLPFHVTTRMRAQFESGDRGLLHLRAGSADPRWRRHHGADGGLDRDPRRADRQPGRVLRPASLRAGLRSLMLRRLP